MFYRVESIHNESIFGIVETSQRDQSDRDKIFNDMKDKLKKLIIYEGTYKGLECFRTRDRLYYKRN